MLRCRMRSLQLNTFGLDWRRKVGQNLKGKGAAFRGSSIAIENGAGIKFLRGRHRRRSGVLPITRTTVASCGLESPAVRVDCRVSGIRAARRPYLSGPRCEV